MEGTTKELRMTYSEDHHTPRPRYGRLAIMAFLAWYIIPRIG